MQKPGYLTSEFWLVFITLTLTNLGTLPVPEKFRWIITLGVVVGYALSRAIAKFGGPPAEVAFPVDPAAVTPAQRRELAKDRKRAEADAGGAK